MDELRASPDASSNVAPRHNDHPDGHYVVPFLRRGLAINYQATGSDGIF